MAVRCALVTRPRAQAEPWCERLQALGVPAKVLPLIDIAPAADPEGLRRWFASLAGGPAAPAASLVMFVSPNAAQCLVDVLPDEGSLAMMMAHELAHIVLGHPLVNPQFAFADRMMVDDEVLLKTLKTTRDAKQEAAADAKDAKKK